MGNEFQQLSTDAQRAVEEFAQDFALALTQSGVEQWAKVNGLYRQSRSLKTTYPIPTSAAGYDEFKGDVKYRSLFERSLSLTPKTWQDGVAELASTVEAPDFTGWAAEPAAMAAAAESVLNEVIAAALEANATHPLDNLAFFHASHPYNVHKAALGTFSNLISGAGTAPTVANLSLAKQCFRDIKAANGKPAGFRMTHVLVPSEQEELWRDMLERNLQITSPDAGATFGAVDNRHKGTVKLIVSDELTNASYWYPLALNKPGAFPWIVQDEGAPEEIRSDKTSALYATTLKVGVAYILRANGALALPQCIQRWDGTA